jgi:hypothetical protein
MSEIPILPTLYKANSNGKIRKWQISITTENGTSYKIVTNFGDIVLTDNNLVLDKKIQTHVRSIDKGKSNRTLLQQAVLEATSKWNEKKNREAYTESYEKNNDISFSNFRPMLANTFNKSLYEQDNKSRSYKITFPVMVQRKFDGCVCLGHRKQLIYYKSIKKGFTGNGFQVIHRYLRKF